MPKVLYKSVDVHRAVIDLFSKSRGRRVAISAFVGDSAEYYLRKPKGLRLICWPKAGGTNPRVLRKLLDRGADISFVDGLHMKVYWAQDRGAVITSANLSTNALGAGDLKEIGILLDARELDIDRIIKSLKLRKISDAELKKLDREHKEYVVKNRIRTSSKTVSFLDWHVSPSREEWKIGWWDSYGAHLANKAKEISEQEYEIRNPDQFQYGRRGEYRKGDWILTFRLNKRSASVLSWMSVNFVIEVPRSDKKAYNRDYPCQAIQVAPSRCYPAPPFRIDKRFRSAFSKAIGGFGSEKIKNARTSRPPVRFLDEIKSYFR